MTWINVCEALTGVMSELDPARRARLSQGKRRPNHHIRRRRASINDGVNCRADEMEPEWVPLRRVGPSFSLHRVPATRLNIKQHLSLILVPMSRNGFLHAEWAHPSAVHPSLSSAERLPLASPSVTQAGHHGNNKLSPQRVGPSLSSATHLTHLSLKLVTMATINCPHAEWVHPSPLPKACRLLHHLSLKLVSMVTTLFPRRGCYLPHHLSLKLVPMVTIFSVPEYSQLSPW
ncbi:hypothetical protein Bbelb_061010 [Branchiostoma belcheri]|nr:hypothetical protein Bbelb_061010 [Branchiostoma belcheri]